MGTSSSFRIGPNSRKGGRDHSQTSHQGWFAAWGNVRIGWGKQMGEMITSPDRNPPPYDDFGDVDDDLGGVFSSCYTRAPYWVDLLSSLMGMRR